MSEELQHHGILGMKWGVRRYQNYDGSYTQKGLERYKKAESNYNSAKSNYQSTKESYKSGNANSHDMRKAKSDLKTAKKKLNNSYDNLKEDYMADKGKELYKRGKTITNNKLRTEMIGTATSMAAIVTRQHLLDSGKMVSTKYGNVSVANIAGGTIALGGMVATGILGIKDNRDNKYLKAYYAHSSPKSSY